MNGQAGLRQRAAPVRRTRRTACDGARSCDCRDRSPRACRESGWRGAVAERLGSGEAGQPATDGRLRGPPHAPSFCELPLSSCSGRQPRAQAAHGDESAGRHRLSAHSSARAAGPRPVPAKLLPVSSVHWQPMSPLGSSSHKGGWVLQVGVPVSLAERRPAQRSSPFRPTPLAAQRLCRRHSTHARVRAP